MPTPENAANVEAEKFRAETRVTSFLSERLRQSVGKGSLCTRCRRRGKAVWRDGDRIEWLCGPCLGESELEGPMFL